MIWVLAIALLVADAAFIAWRFWEKNREESTVVAAATAPVVVGGGLHRVADHVEAPSTLPAPPSDDATSVPAHRLSGRLECVTADERANRLEIRVLTESARFGDAWRAVDHALSGTGLRNTVREQGHLVFSDHIGRSAQVTLGDPMKSPREILVHAHEAIATDTARSLTSVLVQPTTTSGIWEWK